MYFRTRQRVPGTIDVEISKASTAGIVDLTKLSSIAQFSMTKVLAGIVLRLPRKFPDSNIDELKDIVSFRELSALLSALAVKLPRSRSKMEMLEWLQAKTSNIWVDLYELASETLSSNNEDDVQEDNRVNERKIIQEKEKENIFTKNGENYQDSLISQKRKPFDARLANIISSMYLSPRSNWEDILSAVPSKDAQRYTSTFSAIVPESIPENVSTDKRDIFLFQYTVGEAKNTLKALKELDDKCKDFQ